MSYSKIEQRYCRCIMHVSPNTVRSPYAICTTSVYGAVDKKRTKRVQCLPYYQFEDYMLKELQGYAKKAGIKNVNKTKKGVINQLERYRQQKTNQRKPGPRKSKNKNKTVKELHQICKRKSIKGHWGKNKAWLLKHCI